MLKLPQPLADPRHPTEDEFLDAARWGCAQQAAELQQLAATPA